MTSPPWDRWAIGSALAAGLIAPYFVAWRPVRALLTEHVAFSLLTSIETERSQAFRYDFKRGGLRIGLQAVRLGVDANDYHAPAGRTFLLPAVLLALLFPYRPYWLYLWGFHFAVGIPSLGLVALGVVWTDMAFGLQRLVEQYVVQALSLGAPLFALGYERDVLSASTEPASSSKPS